jgi:hypothetical protein
MRKVLLDIRTSWTVWFYAFMLAAACIPFPTEAWAEPTGGRGQSALAETFFPQVSCCWRCNLLALTKD